MALLLSATIGEEVSPAQLLGEEAAENAVKEAEANAKLEALNEKRKAAGLLSDGT